MVKGYQFYFILILFIGFFAFNSCHNSSKKNAINQTCQRDWMGINDDQVLTVLAENSPISFFLYKGKNMGYEYEILHEFAKDYNLRIQVIMEQSLDSIYYHLNDCKGDIIACNLTHTSERTQYVNFTSPHSTTKQVLIQRKPKNWRHLKKSQLKDSLVTEVEQLRGKQIFVWQHSTYFKQLTKLNNLLKLNIQLVPITGDVTSEELIRMVSEGEIDYTVADENIAKLNLMYYNNIDIDLALSNEQNIAFATRKSSPMLLDTLNAWLEDPKNASTLGEIQRKYFDRSNLTKKALQPYSSVFNDGQLSPYDDIIKEESKSIGWDWRLISSIIYQESKFETYKVSWAGAFGIFQFMPSTAAAYGISPSSSAEAQIKAGIRKLKKNYDQWLDEIPDSTEAIYFTLATYNAGRGHIDDARALSEKYNKDPNRWFDNVNEILLKLSKPKYYKDPVVKNGYMRGIETYEYVTEVMERYKVYQHAFPNDSVQNPLLNIMIQ